MNRFVIILGIVALSLAAVTVAQGNPWDAVWDAIDDLTDRISSLEDAVTSNDDDIAALEARIAALESDGSDDTGSDDSGDGGGDGTCVDGDVRQCGSSDIGACTFGAQTCENGEWGVCEGEVGPSEELCDGIDNDCDGTADEDGACSFDQCTADSDCPTATNADGFCDAQNTCQLSCDAGFEDCNLNDADGCETNIISDSNNCGACGLVCGSGQTCSNGVCV